MVLPHTYVTHSVVVIGGIIPPSDDGAVAGAKGTETELLNVSTMSHPETGPWDDEQLFCLL